MWKTICDVFEKHTLLNKLAARRRFYTAQMHESEGILAFANRIRQLAATLKSMKVAIDDEEMAMAMLNGLPERFDPLISALDALGDEKTFTFEFVKSRLLQEEQRNQQRIESSIHKNEESALVSNQRDVSWGGRNGKSSRKCNHCGRTNHTSDQCFIKFPHLKAEYDKRYAMREKALIAKITAQLSQPDSDFCMMANDTKFSSNASSGWVIDSAATSHMTHDRSCFTSFTHINPHKVELGNRAIVTAVGKGDVIMKLAVNGKINTITFKNVLFIPQFGFQLISVRVLDKLGFTTQFGNNRVLIKKQGIIAATGS